jgi:hypothetical protein
MMRRSDENNNKTAPQFCRNTEQTQKVMKRQNEKFVEEIQKRGRTDERSSLETQKKKKWMIPSREEGWKKRLAFSSPTNALDRKTRRSTTTSSRTMGTSKR